MLSDSFGRTLDYLRVSVTDRCNLRCVYCMPPEGVEWKPHDAMLSFEEVLRLCRIMAGLGIRKVKVTGGEPLVRRGMAPFMGSLKAIPGIEKVTLTTNGFLLGAYLDEAEALGSAHGSARDSLPDAVNISLDALNAESFARITRQEGLRPEGIFPHIGRLLEKGVPVKINCVPVRGLNEGEILPLTALAKDRNIVVRFIELMPLGSAASLTPISGSETAALIEGAYGKLSPFPGHLGNGPAVYYRLPGFAGHIGFINPLSHGFCETCNRLRLSSGGLLKPCLSSGLALDLRTPLRSGASDTELARAIAETASQKPARHNLSGVYGASPADITGRHPDGMFGIGG